MTAGSSASAIFRIELCHGVLLLALLLLAIPFRLLDPVALLLGGLFMAINFLLLGLGIIWAIPAFGSKKRVRVGVALLVVKLLLMLALVSALFFHIELDGLSFVVGVSSLLAATLMERLWLYGLKVV
jgi:hypothetical protein